MDYLSQIRLAVERRISQLDEEIQWAKADQQRVSYVSDNLQASNEAQISAETDARYQSVTAGIAVAWTFALVFMIILVVVSLALIGYAIGMIIISLIFAGCIYADEDGAAIFFGIVELVGIGVGYFLFPSITGFVLIPLALWICIGVAASLSTNSSIKRAKIRSEAESRLGSVRSQNADTKQAALGRVDGMIALRSNLATVIPALRRVDGESQDAVTILEAAGLAGPAALAQAYLQSMHSVGEFSGSTVSQSREAQVKGRIRGVGSVCTDCGAPVRTGAGGGPSGSLCRDCSTASSLKDAGGPLT